MSHGLMRYLDGYRNMTCTQVLRYSISAAPQRDGASYRFDLRLSKCTALEQGVS